MWACAGATRCLPCRSIVISLCGLINPTLQRILHLPSKLCLDAPLVTLGWAVLLRQELGEGFSPGDLASLSALAAGTWALYLADRLRDAGLASTPASLRVEFAIRNRVLLGVLLGLLLMVSLFAILPLLTPAFLGRGAILGTMVAVYYVLFRGPCGKAAAGRFPQLPFKEIMIAACLAGGVFMGSGTPLSPVEAVLFAIAFTGLFLGNCLIISRAEAPIDRLQDQAAFFSREQSSRFLPELVLLMPLLCGTALALTSQAVIGITLLLAAIVLACVAHPRLVSPTHTQAAADGVLLVCWLVPAARWFI